MALWQDVQVVEILLLGASISVSEGDLSLGSLDLGQLGVEEDVDASLLALLQDELVGLLVELRKGVVGVDDSQRRQRTELSDLSVVFPVVPGLQEVVGGDFSLERVFGNVEVSVAVVVVAEPAGLLGVTGSPLRAVHGSIDRAVVVVPSLLETLDVVVVLLHAESKNQLLVLDLVTVLELDGVSLGEDLNHWDSIGRGDVVSHGELGRNVVLGVGDFLALVEWSNELLEVSLAVVGDESGMVA